MKTTKICPKCSSSDIVRIGVAAIIAYVVIAAAGEPLGRWTVTLILAIAFVIIGIVGIVDWKKGNKK